MSPPLVAVFGSSQTLPESSEWLVGLEVGRRIGEAGYGVVTGGYGGTMEAVSLGASQAGAAVAGVTAPPLFPGRSSANRYVTDLIEVPTLAARIGIMMERSRGSIALPGSIGTATELLMAWNVNHIARRNGGRRFPSVAVGDEWRRVGLVLADAVSAVLGDVHWTDDASAGVDWLIGELQTLETGRRSPSL